MTAAEFLAGYAERSGITTEELLEVGLVVVPCSCDFEECNGWGVVHVDNLAPDEVPADLGKGKELLPWCDHVSAVGGEGPIADLGRWPILWECLGCGHLFEERFE